MLPSPCWNVALSLPDRAIQGLKPRCSLRAALWRRSSLPKWMPLPSTPPNRGHVTDRWLLWINLRPPLHRHNRMFREYLKPTNTPWDLETRKGLTAKQNAENMSVVLYMALTHVADFLSHADIPLSSATLYQHVAKSTFISNVSIDVVKYPCISSKYPCITQYRQHKWKL